MPRQNIDASVPNKVTKKYLEKNKAKFFEQQCKKEFEDFLQKHSTVKPVILCAHNGKRYDHRILAHHHLNFKGQVVDSIDIFKSVSPGRNSYSLKNLHNELFGSNVPGAHNAMPDIYALLKIINQLNIETADILCKCEPFSAVQARVAKSV